MRAIMTGLGAYWNVRIMGTMPVIVYAAGRVGSVAMLNALRRAGVFSFKVEFFDHAASASSRFCNRYVLSSRRSVQLIVLVRDPGEVLCSLFFSKIVRGHVPAAASAFKEKDVSMLVEIFQTEVLQRDYMSTYLHWFETEFAPHLGFSIFEKPFDKGVKCARFREGRFDLLVLRTDVVDAEKEKHVKDFLDIDHFELKRENEKSASAEAALYNAFKDQLTMTPPVLDMVYTSTYAHHFFTDQEITAMRQRWNKS